MNLVFNRDFMIAHIEERIATYTESFKKATEYIEKHNKWYDDMFAEWVCQATSKEKIKWFQFVLDHLEPEGAIVITLQDIVPLELGI